jgi:4'-phosphopantetheinyl transferase
VSILPDSEVCIWYRCTECLDSDAVKLADQHLSIEERTRRDRLRFDPDRRDFTIAHDLLRRTLSKYADRSPADWRFVINEHGKPSIESVELQSRAMSFSLSHTRGWVTCAVSLNVPIGVDIERIDGSRHVQEIADKYFSKEEVMWLHQSPVKLRNLRFTELWTLKEALGKAMGVGLSRSHLSASFRLDEHQRIEFCGSSVIDCREWHFALFEPASDVRLAVGMRCGARPNFFISPDDTAERTLAPIRSSA